MSHVERLSPKSSSSEYKNGPVMTINCYSNEDSLTDDEIVKLLDEKCRTWAEFVCPA